MEIMLSAASFGVFKQNCAKAKPTFALTSRGAVDLALQPGSQRQDMRTMANY